MKVFSFLKYIILSYSMQCKHILFNKYYEVAAIEKKVDNKTTKSRLVIIFENLKNRENKFKHKKTCLVFMAFLQKKKFEKHKQHKRSLNLENKNIF